MQKNNIIIPETFPVFSAEDFLYGTTPYEFLAKFDENPFKKAQMVALMGECAKRAGIRNFVSLYKEYLKQMSGQRSIEQTNYINFEGQPLANLECGTWEADDFGITAHDKFGFEIVACSHPIMPVQRLVNIDTGLEKLMLAFRKGKTWRQISVEKSVLASNNSIIKLADSGVAVTSENSRYLVKYLSDVENLNFDKIPEYNSVGRLGWVGDYGFSPYVEDLVYDGEVNYKHLFDTVATKGKYGKWLDIVRDVRKNADIVARIVLAGSFASVCLEKIGALPFFIHLWGTTETGKTVTLLLAASVWANPALGEYIQTFDATSVGQEMVAGFLNSLPMIIDELQIAKNRKDFDESIYKLSEGVGRVRGSKTGGTQKVKTWHNCIITTGEMPITTESSGGGAKNRIVEIECNDMKIFKDPVTVAETLKKNYGFAGREFVQLLHDEDIVEELETTYKRFLNVLSDKNITDKQSASAAAILAADFVTEKYIFKDGIRLSPEDIKPFLLTKKEVSANERAYDYLLETLAVNAHRFERNSFDSVWGVRDEEYIYIIKSKFDEIMNEGGYNAKAFLSHLARKDLIVTERSAKRNTRLKKIVPGGSPVRCVWLKRPDDADFEKYELDENAPF